MTSGMGPNSDRRQVRPSGTWCHPLSAQEANEGWPMGIRHLIVLHHNQGHLIPKPDSRSDARDCPALYRYHKCSRMFTSAPFLRVITEWGKVWWRAKASGNGGVERREGEHLRACLVQLRVLLSSTQEGHPSRSTVLV